MTDITSADWFASIYITRTLFECILLVSIIFLCNSNERYCNLTELNDIFSSIIWGVLSIYIYP